MVQKVSSIPYGFPILSGIHPWEITIFNRPPNHANLGDHNVVNPMPSTPSPMEVVDGMIENDPPSRGYLVGKWESNC